MDAVIQNILTKVKSFEAETDVFLFLPNLIGYARIVLAVLSFLTMQNWPIVTFLFYSLSALLDAFDGHAARLLNQSTKFGALLDQLTDRCGTLCLMFCLAHFYPGWMFFFQLSAFIDIFSHWMHTQVSLMAGKTSHKLIDLSANPILRLYYQNRAVLFSMCAANEAFYVALYMVNFYEGPSFLFGVGLFRFLSWSCLPFAIVKAGISVLQLIAASLNCREIDNADRKIATVAKSD